MCEIECWSCKNKTTFSGVMKNDGQCPNCPAEIDMYTVADQLQKQSKELELKLDEQIAYSKKIEKDAIDCCEFELTTELYDRLSQSPAQSLNKLKADAVRECANALFDKNVAALNGDGKMFVSTDSMKYYANQLLNEGE